MTVVNTASFVIQGKVDGSGVWDVGQLAELKVLICLPYIIIIATYIHSAKQIVSICL